MAKAITLRQAETIRRRYEEYEGRLVDKAVDVQPTERYYLLLDEQRRKEVAAQLRVDETVLHDWLLSELENVGLESLINRIPTAQQLRQKLEELQKS